MRVQYNKQTSQITYDTASSLLGLGLSLRGRLDDGRGSSAAQPILLGELGFLLCKLDQVVLATRSGNVLRHEEELVDSGELLRVLAERELKVVDLDFASVGRDTLGLAALSEQRLGSPHLAAGGELRAHDFGNVVDEELFHHAHRVG